MQIITETNVGLSENFFLTLRSITLKFFKGIDKLIRCMVKEITGLPTDVLDAILYPPRKLIGLRILKPQWEVFLQNINICKCILYIDNPHIVATRNFW